MLELPRHGCHVGLTRKAKQREKPFFFLSRNEDDIFGFCSFSEFWCQFSLQILPGFIFVRFSVLCFCELPLVRKYMLRCKLGLSIFGSVRFWTKINNQTDFIFFLVLEPNRTENRFKPINFGSVRFGFFPFQTSSNRNSAKNSCCSFVQGKLRAWL